MFSVMLITNLFIFWVVLTDTLRCSLIATFDIYIFFLQLYLFIYCGGQLCREKKYTKITKRISFMSFFIYLIFFIK